MRDHFDSTDRYKRSGKLGADEKLQYITEEVAPGGRMLDIGCGSGTFLHDALSRTPVTTGVGIDISANMLPSGLVDSGSPACQYLLGDARSLPFEQASFDVIHVDTVLHHLVGETRQESKRRAGETLHSIIELLADNGMLLITERVHTPRIGSPSGLSAAIFRGLKHASCLLAFSHPNVRRSQPPISFFGVGEIVEMVQNANGHVDVVSRMQEDDDLSTFKSIVVEKSERVNVFVR